MQKGRARKQLELYWRPRGEMEILAGSQSKWFVLTAVLLLGSVASGFAQKLPKPTRVWSVGPLTKSQPHDINNRE